MPHFRHLLCFVFIVTFSLSLRAELKLPALFSDGCVLQQGRTVPIWGWAEPGAKVNVQFDCHNETVIAGENGKWMVRLPALKASSSPQALSITAGNNKKQVENVLVGEVWICGGQSNMDWTLKKLSAKTRDPKHQVLADYIAKEIASAKDDYIRQITVPHMTSIEKPLDDFKGVWIASNPENNSEFSGTAYFFAKQLRKHLNVPVGLIKCPWGGTLVEPWIPASAYQKNELIKPYYDATMESFNIAMKRWTSYNGSEAYKADMAKWQEAVKKARKDKKRAPRKPGKLSTPNNQRVPTTLYNGMINPLVPYAIKGAIWYQGESNQRLHAKQYSVYFSQMIKSWREKWGQGDFSFYYCQLAQFQAAVTEPVAESGWVDVCDQQRKTLALVNTGMAVLSDAGEALDIHPRDKMTAGRRLSLWALRKDYGMKVPAISGPLYRSHEIDAGSVTISFDHVGSGLVVARKPVMGDAKPVDEKLKFFQICGADRQWKWAEAKITSNHQVTVWHEAVANPVAVRYGWASNSEGANLYNKEGLPASLFRTDDF